MKKKLRRLLLADRAPRDNLLQMPFEIIPFMSLDPLVLGTIDPDADKHPVHRLQGALRVVEFGGRPLEVDIDPVQVEGPLGYSRAELGITDHTSVDIDVVTYFDGGEKTRQRPRSLDDKRTLLIRHVPIDKMAHLTRIPIGRANH